jgi:hypothetical protein
MKAVAHGERRVATSWIHTIPGVDGAVEATTSSPTMAVREGRVAAASMGCGEAV